MKPSPGEGLAANFLLALLPPGSIEAAVGRIQNAIFRAYGLLSAVSLPPLVPISFASESEAPRLFESLGGSIPSPYRFKARGYCREGAGLFLGLESGGVWETLRREAEGAGTASREGARSAVRPDAGQTDAVPPDAGQTDAARPGNSPDEPRPLFPTAEGFSLGCWEATGEKAIGDLPELPPLSFSSCSLALIEISVRSGAGQWWREVYTEVLSKRPLR